MEETTKCCDCVHRAHLVGIGGGEDYWACLYILDTKEARPCEPGDNCTVFERGEPMERPDDRENYRQAPFVINYRKKQSEKKEDRKKPDRSLSDKQKECLKLLNDENKSQREAAEILGIHETTVSSWKHNPEFRKKLITKKKAKRKKETPKSSRSAKQTNVVLEEGMHEKLKAMAEAKGLTLSKFITSILKDVIKK